MQVKARRNLGPDGGWHMGGKHEGVMRELLFGAASPLATRSAMTAYRNRPTAPGKRGRPRNEMDFRRLLPHYPDPAQDPAFAAGWLDRYAEAWDAITLNADRDAVANARRAITPPPPDALAWDCGQASVRPAGHRTRWPAILEARSPSYSA